VPAVVALALPLPASAQIDPGVNYDSGSPAGKEYAIPIALGRAEGAGTEDQQAAANTPFGVGIRPPGAGGGRGASKPGEKGGAKGAKGTDGERGSKGSPQSPTRVSPALTARLAEAEGTDGTVLWTLAMALAVILAATLLAFLLRGRPTQPAG